MSIWHRKTGEAAKGQWKGILNTLGVPAELLTGKHGPCPLCAGKDRFRFDNQEGRGTWICNGCGSGDGIALAMKFTGKTYPEIASEIDRMLGNQKFDADKPKAEMSDDQRKAALREVAAKTVRIERGCLADLYLTARGCREHTYAKSLRFAPQLRDGEGGTRPALVATVQAHTGENVTLHRTFLRPDGLAKAEMACPRKLMPGPVPKGSAVRLSDYTGGPLGIAEGIETAMSAMILYSLPVWAALNTSLLAEWIPPEGCDDIAIFGDNDDNFAGHAAAYALAHRLRGMGKEVTVHFPTTVGRDWNDEILAMRRKVA
jgi:putative DNA primase/helicase